MSLKGEKNSGSRDYAHVIITGNLDVLNLELSKLLNEKGYGYVDSKIMNVTNDGQYQVFYLLLRPEKND